jgi:hypothetical protein
MRHVARSNGKGDPWTQAQIILDFLIEAVAGWNSAKQFKGKILSAEQIRQALTMVLDLEETGLSAEERRLWVIAMLELDLGVERWRSKKVHGKLIGVEVDFLTILARHILAA